MSQLRVCPWVPPGAFVRHDRGPSCFPFPLDQLLSFPFTPEALPLSLTYFLGHILSCEVGSNQVNGDLALQAFL